MIKIIRKYIMELGIMEIEQNEFDKWSLEFLRFRISGYAYFTLHSCSKII